MNVTNTVCNEHQQFFQEHWGFEVLIEKSKGNTNGFRKSRVKMIDKNPFVHKNSALSVCLPF